MAAGALRTVNKRSGWQTARSSHLGRQVASLVTCIILVAAASAPVTGQERPRSALQLRGKPAPDFDLAVLDGKLFDERDNSMAPKRVRLREERGKVLVLNFFATWCTPCRAEHPTLLDLRRRYRGRVEVYTILVEDSPKNARRYIAEGFTGLPILVGTETDIAERYGVGKGVPVTFVIDRSGLIRHVIVGGLVSTTWKYAMPIDSLVRAL